MSARRYESYAVGNSRPVLFTPSEENGTFKGGFVVTQYGVVGVWSWSNYERAETAYTFVHEAREHRMHETVTRAERGTALVAARYARSVIAGAP